ncbi:hypothetical protein P153DRAFT_367989 [Dothidotthia symphoricarpi CBS 119687]|uniref:DUF7732 domain-containing protein n=1 Tax=Dothidotthia symphoricarpi CBS 119687 TaxID=1392245 RepID=A0A6A6AAB9_9PLEO|nr:uncharacterized protein P153DRAFT_367989 [Dothidotthia symphoricarpi CBS 119687]KAF2128105.1 hypothetical protein P153DRAFT_367989 [Dothidotthia symphoricarpi CBS 119687]
MKVSQLLTYVAIATQTITAASIPNTNALSVLSERADNTPLSSAILSPEHALTKRKGGGGRAGGSSSGGTSSGGSTSSSGSGRTSGTSSSGGSTSAGSGAARSYGGGGYYGGGAAVPYSAGSRTPKGLLAGALIAPVVLLAIMPGLWLYNTYPYYYNNPYRFNNQTQTNANNPNGTNTTLPVMCLCQEYSVCGCDENDDQQYINSLVGNGSYAALNKQVVTVSDVNGTQTLVLNGTLANGTTAPGGSDSAGVSLSAGKYSGYWVMGLVVLYTVLA